MNFTIWIRNPFPFRYGEREAVQESLNRTYGVRAVYLKEWPVDHVCVDNVNITLARKIADTLRVIHRQWAISARRNGSRVNAEDVETEVRGSLDGRPEWAKIED
jgi:hypothetical protein